MTTGPALCVRFGSFCRCSLPEVSRRCALRLIWSCRVGYRLLATLLAYLWLGASAGNLGRARRPRGTPNLSALCGGILLSCLRVHVAELFRVTNVVNPSDFLYVSPSDCYKRRQSARYFARNRVFWAWFDDVCNRTPY